MASEKVKSKIESRLVAQRNLKILPAFDIETIQKAILADFPDLTIEKVELINNGWDNIVALINDEYIFRFPKDDGDEYGSIGKNFDAEVKILSFLQDKVTLQIPKVEFLGQKFTYMGYEKIPGNDLVYTDYLTLSDDEKNQLVFDLANFLKEIHTSVSLEQANEFNVDTEDLNSYSEMVKNLLIDKITDPQILKFINQTCDEYESFAKENQNLVFLYNDLHTENMAFDSEKKKINGIFDFSDCMIGDVYMDFHSLYKFDPQLMKAVAEKYQELTSTKLNLRRMVVTARIAELCDLAQFIDQPESRVYKNTMNNVKKWMSEVDIFKNTNKEF